MVPRTRRRLCSRYPNEAAQGAGCGHGPRLLIWRTTEPGGGGGRGGRLHEAAETLCTAD
ncbi:hypothetical protein IG631_00602 [Alternaria alternata]|nr:hypothetical protein IG631_00602 [Alternaria alternata]